MEPQAWEEAGQRHTRFRFYDPTLIDCPECGGELRRYTQKNGDGYQHVVLRCPTGHAEHDQVRYSKFRGQFNRDLALYESTRDPALLVKMRKDVDRFGCWKYETDALLTALEQEEV